MHIIDFHSGCAEAHVAVGEMEAGCHAVLVYVAVAVQNTVWQSGRYSLALMTETREDHLVDRFCDL